MRPAVGLRNLVRRLNTGVLPARLGPISAWIAPGRTAKSTAGKGTKAGNSFVSPFVSSRIDMRRSVLRESTGRRNVPSMPVRALLPLGQEQKELEHCLGEGDVIATIAAPATMLIGGG